MNAVIYYRVSTGRQAQDDRQSLPAQHEDAPTWCASHGLTIVGAYEDHETGTRSTRAGYQAMLAAVRAGDVGVVVCREFSRFGRNRREAVTRAFELQDLGVEIHEFGVGHVIADDDAGYWAIASKAFSADSQAKEIKRNSKRGQQATAGAGKVFMSRTSYGYKRTVVASDGVRVVRVISIDETEAAVVRDIFTWYAVENRSCNAIAIRLNAAGVLTKRGKRWDDSTVKTIIRNRTYTGETAWAGFPQTLPAIIPLTLWEAARDRRARKAAMPRRAQSSPNLLAGLVRCAVCGGPFIVTHSRVKGHEYRYYVCNRSRSGGCENRRRLVAEDFEQWAIGEVGAGLGEVEPVVSGTSIVNLEVDAERIRAEKAAVESRRDEMIRRGLRGEEVDLVTAFAQEEVAALGKALDAVEGELRRRHRQEQSRVALRSLSLAGVVAGAGPGGAKATLQDLFSHVEVPREGPSVVVY